MMAAAQPRRKPGGRHGPSPRVARGVLRKRLALRRRAARGVGRHPRPSAPGSATCAPWAACSSRRSCGPDAQAGIERATALLHSFFYDEARRVFGEVAATQPACAMAHWGVAMTYWHPIWTPPAPDERAAGRQAIERARAAGAGRDIERGPDRGALGLLRRPAAKRRRGDRHERSRPVLPRAHRGSRACRSSPGLRTSDGASLRRAPRGRRGRELLRARAARHAPAHRREPEEPDARHPDPRALPRHEPEPPGSGPLPDPRLRLPEGGGARPAGGPRVRGDRAVGAARAAHAVPHLHAARHVGTT